MKHIITPQPQTIWEDSPYINIKVYNDKNRLISMFKAEGPNYELYISSLTAESKLCLKYLLVNEVVEIVRSSLFVRTYRLTQKTLLGLL